MALREDILNKIQGESNINTVITNIRNIFLDLEAALGGSGIAPFNYYSNTIIQPADFSTTDLASYTITASGNYLINAHATVGISDGSSALFSLSKNTIVNLGNDEVIENSLLGKSEDDLMFDAIGLHAGAFLVGDVIKFSTTIIGGGAPIPCKLSNVKMTVIKI
jgi:hypothetical protein